MFPLFPCLTLLHHPNRGLSLVLVSGQPIREPIVQHGPFVMNTREEIQKAFIDYQSGRNGFENAVVWESEIGQRRLR